MSAASFAEALASGDKQYRRLWRWHFYAAFLVIPFILWQGVTGVLYLWHEQIADALWPELRFVEAGTSRIDLDTQLHAAMAGGDVLPTVVKLPADPARSVQFVFEDRNDLPTPRFVDPYRGHVLGQVASSVWLPGLTRKLHGGWPLGKPGSWLLELGACWMIVMVLTGLYLWWPRGVQGFAGVLYPRLRAGSRMFWKDLHSVMGMWFSAIFLAFLITALPWTDVWGNYLLKPLQRATGQSAPAALGVGHSDAHAHAMHLELGPLSLQRVLDTARAEGLYGDLEFRIGAGNAAVTVTEKAGRAANEHVLRIERDSGRILDRADWGDYSLIPRVVSTGVDLHEGTFFGSANRLFNTLTVLALFWLIATGVIGWYKRRPGQGLAPPAALMRPWPRWLKISAWAACMAMPLFGISIVALWAFDGLLLRSGGKADT
jgi:uncharacterized iron-regulated membrane protein